MFELSSIFLTLIAVVNIILAFFVYSQDKLNRTSASFCFFTLFVALWALSILFFQLTENLSHALYFMKFAYASAFLIAVGYYYFSIVFPGDYSLTRRQKFYIVIFPLFFSALLLVPGFLTKQVIIHSWGKEVLLGKPEYAIFLFLFLGFFVGGIFRQWKKFRVSTGIVRTQLFYILIGVLTAGAFGMVFNLFLPSIFFQNFQYIWLGPLFTSILVATIMYAILEHGLFNVKVVATELFVFTLWTLLLFRTFLSETTYDQLINASLLLAVVAIGIFLIRSVVKEIETREKIEHLAEDLRKANERLKELDQRKSEFVSLASHQLRSPLTAIKGYASMLLEGSFGGLQDKVKEAVDKIFQSSERLVTVVEDFLTVSRIEQGHLEYNFARIDFRKLVESVIEDLRPAIEKKGLTLSFNCGKEKQFRITADSGKIAQVVGNLLDNALKYTPKGSIVVRLTKDSQKHAVRLSVTDTGIGMSPETREKIFSKFSRAGNAHEVNVGGTGLGLFIAKQLVEAHHGRINVESDGEGTGSTFYFELPAEE